MALPLLDARDPNGYGADPTPGASDAPEAPLRFLAAAGAAVVAAGHILALVTPHGGGMTQRALSALIAETWALLAWALLRHWSPAVWAAARLLTLLSAGAVVVAALQLAVVSGRPGAVWGSPLQAVAAAGALVTGLCVWGTLLPRLVAPLERYLGAGSRAGQAGLAVLLAGSSGLVSTAVLVWPAGAQPARAGSLASGTRLADALDLPPGTIGSRASTQPGAAADPGGWASADPASAFHVTGRTRTYYVAAEETVWDYAPTGRNGITNAPLEPRDDAYVRNGPGRIGSRYLKCLYRQYTDSSFTTPQQRPDDDAYLGIWGPVIRAEVGDAVTVVLKNSCAIRVGMHPHSVFYQKAAPGLPAAENTSGSDPGDPGVATGERRTYTWLVPDLAGPGPLDGSSVMWMYNSHVDEAGDTQAGLMGPMVITAAGKARDDGSPQDVDREVFEVYLVSDENHSPYLDASVRRFVPGTAPARDDPGFQASNIKHSVNGYLFGNQPGITVRLGQRVRWYLMSVGSDVALHGPHWQGNEATSGAVRMDVVGRLPASMLVGNLTARVPGSWLFHCHLNDQVSDGIIARYRVL